MVVHRPGAFLVLTLFLAASLAGCLGGDDPASSSIGDGGDFSGGSGGRDRGGGSSDGGTGDVQGIVINDGFAPIHGASVRLTRDGNTVRHTSTDLGGGFHFQDVDAGAYRLEATAACCRETVTQVTIRAEETVTMDLRLDRRTGEETQRPFFTDDEWNGFLGCGVGLVGIQEAPCTLDENHDPSYRWNVTQGLRTLYLFMDWEPQATGPVLSMQVSTGGEAVYASMQGPPPLQLRIDNDEIDDPALKWEHIEGQRELRLDVLPGGEAGVVYQQEFKVFMLEWHWRAAPEGFEFDLG